MSESSQSGTTVGKPSEPITRVLEYKGATITLTGPQAEVERTIRLLLDCPSWCIKHPENEPEVHQASIEVAGLVLVIEQRGTGAPAIHVYDDLSLTESQATELALGLAKAAEAIRVKRG